MSSIADSGLLRFSNLSRLSGVEHAFADAAALSGFDANRREDRRRLLRAVMGEGGELVPTHQTHSANLAVVRRGEDCDFARAEGGIDGLVTTERGLLLHAISADCPLLFLAHPSERAPGVAISHCGWRGVARGIVTSTVDRLLEATGANGGDLVAAISPGAGGCCYEVGSEVLDGLEAAGVRVSRCIAEFVRPDGRISHRLDLRAAIVDLLESRDLAPSAIECSSACTICGGNRFHSYRRSATTAGRMSGVIALR